MATKGTSGPGRIELLAHRQPDRRNDLSRLWLITAGASRRAPSQRAAPHRAPIDTRSFLLPRVQPALSGLIDRSLSTLAPIFAVALGAHRPLTAPFAGAATALGAGVRMPVAEGLSATGDLTGRGSPGLRGALTGGGTFAGGIVHTLPFLNPGYGAAISAAIVVVASELLILAWLRRR